MTTDTKLNQLIINKLTQEQYDEAKAAGTLSDTELYITDSDDEALTNNKISNCITYIPQDIKLELNNGTLTLKAGSKLYVPNGFESDGTTRKFDVVVTESDKVCAGYNTGTCIAFIDANNGGLYANFNINLHTYSGSSAPTDFIGFFYNTNTNTVGVRFDTSSQFSGRYSLPIAIVTNSSTTVCSSIDQVFNGFGYIGSTIFALPGVKGLIPNGRNADGSLKSIEILLDSVKTSTFPVGATTTSINMGLTTDAAIDANFFTYYEKENIIKNLQQSLVLEVNCATLDTNNGKITSFTPKTVFHALDYNDKSTISGWSMPDYNAGISFSFSTSMTTTGQTYTAPSDGVIYFSNLESTNVDTFSVYINNILIARLGDNNNSQASWKSVNVRVSKGDIFKIASENNYTSSGFISKFFPLKGVN